MLLGLETKIFYNVSLTFTFDDNTTKTVAVSSNQYILIEFVRGGCRFRKACKLVTIDPVIKDVYTKDIGCTLVIDCAEQFESCRLRIDSEDVRNVKIVTKEYVEDLLKTPDYIITPDMFEEEATIPDDNMELDPDFSVDSEDGDDDTGKDNPDDNKDNPASPDTELPDETTGTEE